LSAGYKLVSFFFFKAPLILTRTLDKPINKDSDLGRVPIMAGNKKVYEVEENETVSQCLDRIKKDGYMPVKRIEKPIFQEKVAEDGVSYEPVARKIVFEVRMDE
jgi:hypothetical protein